MQARDQDAVLARPQRDIHPAEQRLVCKAHRLLYHSTLGLRVIKKKGTEGVVIGVMLTPATWRGARLGDCWHAHGTLGEEMVQRCRERVLY